MASFMFNSHIGSASMLSIWTQVGPVFPGAAATRESKACVLPRLAVREKELVERAKKYALEQSIKSVLVRQTQQHQQQQMSNLKRAQAVVLLSRIYVGNINFEVKEDAIRTAFLPFGPIKDLDLGWDAILNKHKGFAFIEYELPEAAMVALEQMNGVMLGGRNVKVGRPSNMPQAQPIVEELIAEAKLSNRIYVSSVHLELTERDLQSVFEAFGAIVSCRLQPDPRLPGRHRGFGYVEFETSRSALDAVSSMNGFDLGGQLLRVGRAITPPNTLMPTAGSQMPTAAAVAAASITAKVMAMEAESLGAAKANGAGGQGFGAGMALPPPSVVAPQLGAAGSAYVLHGGVAPAPLPPPAEIPVMTLGPGGVVRPANALIPSFVQGAGGPAVSCNGTVVGTPSLAAARAAAAAVASDAGSAPLPEQTGSLQQQEQVEIRGREARHVMMHKLMRQAERFIVVLRNMCGPEEVDDELEAEVNEECNKYGAVLNIVIYQECQSDAPDADVLVKIFVEFGAPEAATEAVASLDGRYFGGRMIGAQRYDSDLFAAGDLSA